MAQNPPPGTQRIIPYILYSDAQAAIEYLKTVFGFEERCRMEMGPGVIGHAELACHDSIVMVATAPDRPGTSASKDMTSRHCFFVCYVDDVDSHFQHAKQAGAQILDEPKDQFYGDRTYRTLDSEGNEWFFHTHVKDVDPADMKPPEGCG